MSKDFASSGVEISIPDMPTFDELSDSQKLSIINARLDDIQTRIHDTETMVRKVIDELAPIVKEVIPMVNNLVENPMVRMMLRGKK